MANFAKTAIRLALVLKCSELMSFANFKIQFKIFTDLVRNFIETVVKAIKIKFRGWSI